MFDQRQMGETYFVPRLSIQQMIKQIQLKSYLPKCSGKMQEPSAVVLFDAEHVNNFKVSTEVVPLWNLEAPTGGTKLGVQVTISHLPLEFQSHLGTYLNRWYLPLTIENHLLPQLGRY